MGPLNKFRVCVTILLGMVLACYAHGSEQGSDLPFTIHASLDSDATTLVLEIEDRNDVLNACDYYIQRFEYLDVLDSLVVQTARPECRVDRYGKGKTVLRWTVPQFLRADAQLTLVVDRRVFGTLRFSHGRVEFQEPKKF